MGWNVVVDWGQWRSPCVGLTWYSFAEAVVVRAAAGTRLAFGEAGAAGGLAGGDALAGATVGESCGPGVLGFGADTVVEDHEWGWHVFKKLC